MSYYYSSLRVFNTPKNTQVTKKSIKQNGAKVSDSYILN